MIFVEYIKKKIHIYKHRLNLLMNKRARNYVQSLQIMNSEETVDYIIKHRCSVSRYGDGEFYVMAGGSNGFQRVDERLAARLREVITSPDANLLLCIPYSLKSIKELTLDSQLFAIGFIDSNLMDKVQPFVPAKLVYGDALFTRFYMSRKNKSREKMSSYINKLKSIWKDQDILIVEGIYSKSGVDNDLFDNAKSIQRILCPPRDAFDRYDEILSSIKELGQGKLVIMALGMAATVLAYDLMKEGIWAVDLGHIDMEYEWFRMGVKRKTAIPNKIVDEVAEKGDFESDSKDMQYKSQIIRVIS